MRLSPRDLDALHGAILAIHELRDADAFRQAVPGIIARVLFRRGSAEVDDALDVARSLASHRAAWKSPRDRGPNGGAVFLPSETGGHTSGRRVLQRNRLILALLRPHIELARRNTERATAELASEATTLCAFGLTPREIQVAMWLARGKTNPEIAVILHTAVRTAEKHVERILHKLSVENRTTAAVIIASRIG